MAEVERPTMDGAARIAVERQRQVEAEGWTAEHDEQHLAGDLTAAAHTYSLYAWWQVSRFCGWTESMVLAMCVDDDALNVPAWPWDERWFKPSPDPVRNLEKAGALIAAEIDRLQRLAAAAQGTEGGEGS